MSQTRELFDFAESYSNYPDAASNIAIDAEEQGQPDTVVNFFETLGDTVVEDKEQVMGMIEQLDDDMPAM
jgi:hypothetical protein